MKTPLWPRLVEPRLAEALADTPVVLIHGPRQCGKTTLAQQVGGRLGYQYFSLDDASVLDAARADPQRFVAELPSRVVLDEAQRAPGIFPALKLAVDRGAPPGSFLLTGSSNILLLPALADSLAGRMGILRLHPLAQVELARRRPRFMDALFDEGFPTGVGPRLGRALAGRIAAGGFPAALARATPRRQAAWRRDYLDALVQRDVRSLARIASLEMLPRLLQLAAGQSARLFNASELAAPFQQSRKTIRDYLTLLERVFLLDELPPWHGNPLSRLVKTPKLHMIDTGLACVLAGHDEASLWQDRQALGRLCETFVFQELRRLADGHEEDFRFHHFRDRDGYEVDIVVERGAAQLAGVEVKAAATVGRADFRGLERLRRAAGERFRAGVLLYDGEACLPFGPGLRAVPITALWEGREEI